MYCPSCGNKAADDQKFCRACGMNLQKVYPALAEHLVESGIAPPITEMTSEIRRMAVRRVMWAAMLMFAGVGVAIVGKMITHDEQVSGSGALISVLGIFLIAYFMLSAAYKLTVTDRGVSGRSKLSEAKTTSQLQPER